MWSFTERNSNFMPDLLIATGAGTGQGINFGDGDSGLRESADDNLVIYIAASGSYTFAAAGLTCNRDTNTFFLSGSSASETSPSLCPSRADGNTGIGWKQADWLSLIAGGASLIQANKTAVAGDTALLIYDTDNNTVERVTVGAADSGGVGYKLLCIPN